MEMNQQKGCRRGKEGGAGCAAVQNKDIKALRDPGSGSAGGGSANKGISRAAATSRREGARSAPPGVVWLGGLLWDERLRDKGGKAQLFLLLEQYPPPLPHPQPSRLPLFFTRCGLPWLTPPCQCLKGCRGGYSPTFGGAVCRGRLLVHSGNRRGAAPGRQSPPPVVMLFV